VLLPSRSLGEGWQGAPKIDPGGFAPPDPPTRSLAGLGSSEDHSAKTRSVRVTRSLTLARG
jgi:hypothetical protein